MFGFALVLFWEDRFWIEVCFTMIYEGFCLVWEVSHWNTIQSTVVVLCVIFWDSFCRSG